MLLQLIRLQNGSLMFTLFDEIVLKIKGQKVWSSKNGWFMDIVNKLLGSAELAAAQYLLQGFGLDTGVANVMDATNAGFGARALLLRGGVPTASAPEVKTVCKLDIPLFQGTQSLVYMPPKSDFKLIFTLKTVDANVVMMDAAATLPSVKLTKLWIECMQYFPVREAEDILLANLAEGAYQNFIYPDWIVEEFTDITAKTKWNAEISLENGTIEGIIVGFQSPTQLNKRQHLPADISNIHVKRDGQIYPEGQGYNPAMIAPLTRMWSDAYHDLLTGLGEGDDKASSILTSEIWKTSQNLYYFDLRKNPAKVPEAKDLTKEGDKLTLYTTFASAQTLYAYVAILTTSKLGVPLKKGLTLKMIQGTFDGSE